jgi:hypothetical protein
MTQGGACSMHGEAIKYNISVGKPEENIVRENGPKSTESYDNCLMRS